MADTKVTDLTAATPDLDDALYLVSDPGGTPVSAKATLQAVMDVFEANFAAPATAIVEGDRLGNGTKLVTADAAGTEGQIAGYDAAGKLVPISSADLTDPGADRLLFWDDSAGGFAFLTAGTGLSLMGTTLTATIQSSPDISGSDQVTNVVSLTTSEYNAGTPDASTLYLITDAT